MHRNSRMLMPERIKGGVPLDIMSRRVMIIIFYHWILDSKSLVNWIRKNGSGGIAGMCMKPVL